MRSSDAAFFPAIKISFTDTRKTPDSRNSSCVIPLTANDRLNNPTVSRITTLVHGSLDLNSFMAIAPSSNKFSARRGPLECRGPSTWQSPLNSQSVPTLHQQKKGPLLQL